MVFAYTTQFVKTFFKLRKFARYIFYLQPAAFIRTLSETVPIVRNPTTDFETNSIYFLSASES